MYTTIDFIAHATAMLLGVYWIFLIFYRYMLPIAFNSELEVIQKIYRVAESSEATNVNSLKNAMQEMADKLHADQPVANTLGEKLQ